MKTRQGNTLQSLRSVQKFLDEHAAELADVNSSGARQQLDAEIVELTEHVQDQTGSLFMAMGLTQRQYALRKALLRDHMVVIARIARAKAELVPDLAPFKVPRGRPTVQRLSAAARGMANAAAPLAPVFVANGARADFIERLEGAATALVGSVTERAQSQGVRRGATIGLKTTLSAGRRTVHILDALVQSALQDNPSLLANWDVVKRVRLIASRSAESTIGNSVQAAPDVSPASASQETPEVAERSSPLLRLLRAQPAR